MILKNKDSIAPRLKQLEQIQKLTYLSESQRAEVEKQIRILKAGDQGEVDSAYFLNFDSQDSKHRVIIHDLRLQYGDFTAQIDHLLINRLLDFYVLETKHFSQGIKITETGEFLRWQGKQYVSMESPIAQNNRHIQILDKIIQQEALLPKRLGINLPATFISYVLVSPKSRIIRPKTKDFDTSMVIKADQFRQAIDESTDKASAVTVLTSLAKIVSLETIQEIGTALVQLHKPAQFNYFKQLGIPSEPRAPPKIIVKPKQAIAPPEISSQPPVKPKVVIKQTQEKKAIASKYFCLSCKAPISQKVAIFCFQNKQRFQGKAYCFECQKKMPTSSS